MSPAKLWLRVFFAGFVVITALLVVTLLTPVPYGDLSRIGRVSDHEFGWKLQPPPVVEQDLIESPVSQADILIVGDSFSMTHQWQAVLVHAGYRVTTTYWATYSEALCGDVDAWLAEAGFHGKLVIFQSVERLLDERMQKSEACVNGRMSRKFTAKPEPFIHPFTAVPGFELNWTARLTSGLVTYRNTRRAKETRSDVLISRATMVRLVPDGCDRFSHRLCDRALFYADDVDNGPLTLKTLERFKAFTAARKATPLLWMVIPNKTTTYLKPDYSREFVDGFNKLGVGPDLFSLMREQRLTMRDLYFPNDTHLSTHGQVFLGQFMLQEVRKILPPPASTPP
ncbi:hypothetical protein [Variovorax sp. dw_954]|uniref:hypothetical protein n=1 Tax=Variovorax sp. dw_954 TaxID=2720078 RepID=UPI001BD30EA0|nr:hypothetical protein [Variovorax sp. dw_954]